MYLIKFFFIPNSIIKFIHLSNIVMFFNSSNGFGVVKVRGFNLLPNPAHKSMLY